jgi:OHCU decarboxylase
VSRWNPALIALNEQADNEAATAFRQCCGSSVWASAMSAGRPFENTPLVHLTADNVLDRLDRDDWLEAFAAHPRIGEPQPREASDNRSDWSADEQAGLGGAAQSTQERLAAANNEYFERFGYIFLICATGKTAEDILAALERRLQNDPEIEIDVAAAQQRLITHLRLDKLLDL